jgi:uncharacterized protein (TIGR02757 family)
LRNAVEPAGVRLKAYLDRLYETLGARYLSPDPLEFLHRYDDPADIEVFGVFASGLAYGRVDHIRASLGRLATRMGPHPARFVRDFDLAHGARAFRGVVHRFHGPTDLALLAELLRRALEEAGSLHSWFARGFDPSHADIGPALVSFCRRMTERGDLPAARGAVRGHLPADSPVRFFFPSPAGGSACKRLNLYLRWMVRKQPGLDFGFWNTIPKAKLVIPLDTHVARIAAYVGLTSRKSVGWKMALDVTESLRRLDPEDPVKYDFAISRMGILDYCPRRRDEMKCASCMIKPVCTL